MFGRRREEQEKGRRSRATSVPSTASCAATGWALDRTERHLSVLVRTHAWTIELLMSEHWQIKPFSVHNIKLKTLVKATPSASVAFILDIPMLSLYCPKVTGEDI